MTTATQTAIDFLLANRDAFDAYRDSRTETVKTEYPQDRHGEGAETVTHYERPPFVALFGFFLGRHSVMSQPEMDKVNFAAVEAAWSQSYYAPLPDFI